MAKRDRAFHNRCTYARVHPMHSPVRGPGHSPTFDTLSHARRAKLPPLSLEEVLTGVFVIAIGGLMVSFSI